MNNIILIGMPSAGKSTVGVVLAKALGYGFIDTDLIIQQQQGEKLYKIIEQKGIDEFLKIENDCVASLEAENSVVATGGSVIFGNEAMQNLKRLGTVVYLETDEDEIERRLKNIKTRGVVMAENETVADIYKKRVPLYEKYADITVRTSNNRIETTVETIIKSIGEK